MSVDAARTKHSRRTCPEMTRDEIAELTRTFAPELARGWIPTPYDIEDALESLRHR